MHHDGASSGASASKMTQYYTSAPSLSLNASSGLSDFTSPHSYSSIFFTPSTSTTTRATAASSTASDLSLLMLEHQELLNRHRSCLNQLQKTFKEAETLRQENTNLRVANRNLTDRNDNLADAYLYNSNVIQYGPEHIANPISSIMERFADLHVREKMREAVATAPPWGGCESPTSVIESDRAERDTDRVSLPKSISVRSTGFLKAGTSMTQPSQTTETAILPPRGGGNRNKSTKDGPQKVYVRGGNKKDGPIDPIELDVYNQGMFKTELCNKWQETGACPYGDHCQFAHGFAELRPVLRHPRYKTEVCRMVLAGDPCPYGHRCHFRHALTEQEKLVVPLKLD